MKYQKIHELSATTIVYSVNGALAGNETKHARYVHTHTYIHPYPMRMAMQMRMRMGMGREENDRKNATDFEEIKTWIL